MAMFSLRPSLASLQGRQRLSCLLQLPRFSSCSAFIIIQEHHWDLLKSDPTFVDFALLKHGIIQFPHPPHLWFLNIIVKPQSKHNAKCLAMLGIVLNPLHEFSFNCHNPIQILPLSCLSHKETEQGNRGEVTCHWVWKEAPGERKQIKKPGPQR